MLLCTVSHKGCKCISGPAVRRCRCCSFRLEKRRLQHQACPEDLLYTLLSMACVHTGRGAARRGMPGVDFSNALIGPRLCYPCRLGGAQPTGGVQGAAGGVPHTRGHVPDRAHQAVLPRRRARPLGGHFRTHQPVRPCAAEHLRTCVPITCCSTAAAIETMQHREQRARLRLRTG